MWNEGDLEEGTDHARHIAGLVAAKEIPLVDHQTVHGYPHVSITTAKHAHIEDVLHTL